MKVLITGGAGFIGSHLAARLLRRNTELTIVDNFHPYYPADRKKERMRKVSEAGRFVFLEEDLISEEACQSFFKRHSFDPVIHLAAVPGVPFSISNPDMYIDMNIKATVNLLKWAGESGVKHFIFASSSSVYGEQSNRPLSENMAIGKVISPYAATKISGESFCHVYKHLYGFRLTILRFFTAYGPSGRPDLAIPKFINKLLRGEEIEVYGTETARDYTYIDDLVQGIEAAIQQPQSDGIYNLGSGNPITMMMLLDELKRHFPDMKVRYEGRRSGDVTSTWADISKATEVLGYRPAISFSEGMARTIAWEKETYLQA